jgi:beta-mannanase
MAYCKVAITLILLLISLPVIQAISSYNQFAKASIQKEAIISLSGTIQNNIYTGAFVSYEHGFLWPTQVEQDIKQFTNMTGKGLFEYSVGSTIYWGQDPWMINGSLSYAPLFKEGLIKAIQIIIFPSTEDRSDNLTVADIAQGKDDSYIETIAGEVKNFTYPVFIRFGAEMNINQGQLFSFGENPSTFIDAWRRFVDVFREQGASNAVFVWNPNWCDIWNGHPASQYYPGDEYVDYVGIDMYQETPTTDPEIQISNLYQEYSNAKPILICEWGVNWIGENFSDIDRAAYMTKFFDAIEKRNDIVGISYWYIALGDMDFTFNSTDLPITTQVYFDRISNSRYISNFP